MLCARTRGRDWEVCRVGTGESRASAGNRTIVPCGFRRGVQTSDRTRIDAHRFCARLGVMVAPFGMALVLDVPDVSASTP